MLEHAISWITLGATSVRRGSRAEDFGQRHLKKASRSYIATSHGHIEREQGVPTIAPVVLIKDQVPVLALQPLLAVPVITNVVEDAIAVMVTLKLGIYPCPFKLPILEV